MSLTKVLMTVQILLLISCASKPTSSQNLSSQNQLAVEALSPEIKAPDIGINPEQAFFPLRRDPSDNVIKPSYQSKVCVKKFIVCLKWGKRTLFFNDTEWFYQNGFGLFHLPYLK